MMAQILNGNPSPCGRQDAARITTPAGSTIEPTSDGRYQVCDARSHCRRADNLWEAQQLVQWAEVHHRPVDSDLP